MNYTKNISEIMFILGKELKKFETPVATEISEKTRDPFMVLVSCLLSLRTMDKITGSISEKLFEIAKTPEEIANISLGKLEKIIKSVNYYKTKAKRIKEISKILLEKYNGKVPDKFEELISLTGVGKKTASIVMMYGYNKSHYIPVDSHVHVITNRLGWAKTKNADQTMDELMKIIPKKTDPI